MAKQICVTFHAASNPAVSIFLTMWPLSFFNREKLFQIFDRLEAKVTQPDAKFRIRFRSFEKFPPICSTPIQRQPPDRSWKSSQKISAFWKLSKEPSVRLSGNRLSQYNLLFHYILVAFKGPWERLSKKIFFHQLPSLTFQTYKVIDIPEYLNTRRITIKHYHLQHL